VCIGVTHFSTVSHNMDDIVEIFGTLKTQFATVCVPTEMPTSLRNVYSTFVDMPPLPVLLLSKV
jgi:hypothetical protein